MRLVVVPAPAPDALVGVALSQAAALSTRITGPGVAQGCILQFNSTLPGRYGTDYLHEVSLQEARARRLEHKPSINTHEGLLCNAQDFALSVSCSQANGCTAGWWHGCF